MNDIRNTALEICSIISRLAQDPSCGGKILGLNAWLDSIYTGTAVTPDKKSYSLTSRPEGYAGDYELHHHGKNYTELKEWYIKCLKDKLYTEKELAEPLKDYGDYQRRQYYLHNYYGDHEPHESQFQIFHSDVERQAFAERSPL